MKIVLKFAMVQLATCVFIWLLNVFLVRDLVQTNTTPPHQPRFISVHIAEPANENHKDLKVAFSLPAIENPVLIKKDQVAGKNVGFVIGILIENQPIAFSLKGMTGPGSHVVKFERNNKNFCVTYCDLVDCARVLFKPTSKGPVNMTVGGQDIDEQMVLLLDGVRYGQSSSNIPLLDHDFEVLDWSEWVQRYPNSLVYSP